MECVRLGCRQTLQRFIYSVMLESTNPLSTMLPFSASARVSVCPVLTAICEKTQGSGTAGCCDASLKKKGPQQELTFVTPAMLLLSPLRLSRDCGGSDATSAIRIEYHCAGYWEQPINDTYLFTDLKRSLEADATSDSPQAPAHAIDIC